MRGATDFICLTMALALVGCATPSPTTETGAAQIVYASAAALDAAEQAALVYEQLPSADPAVKAKIRALDNTAYGVIKPLVDAANSGTSVITAAEAQATQDVLSALTACLSQNGVK